VGIGTTSPTVTLDVYNGSGWGGLDLDGTSGGEIRIQKAGTLYGQIYANDSTALVISAENGLASTLFSTNGSERMRIDSSGNVNIGVSSAISTSANTADGFTFSESGGYAWLSVSDTGGIYVQRQNDNSVFSFYRTTANVGSISVTASATAYNTSSDKNNKHRLMPYNLKLTY
jgi:hypothetical protein